MKDLHLHLSGSTPSWVLWEIIKESGFKSSARNYHHFNKSISMGDNNVKDLDAYLDILHTIDDAQSSPSAVEKSVYHAFVSSALNRCEYLEIRWNPTKRSQKGRIDLDKLIISARSGMERAKANFGIGGKLILCMGRDCTPKANRAVVDKAVKYAGKGVIGIDLAGPYNGGVYKKQLGLFKTAFEECYNRGLITTVHCAEIEHKDLEDEIDWVAGIENIERIGHGVQIALKYPEKLEQFKGKTFEICISSNLRTGAIKDKTQFREIFARLKEHDIEYTLGTDATFRLDTTIKREHEIYTEIMNMK